MRNAIALLIGLILGIALAVVLADRVQADCVPKVRDVPQEARPAIDRWSPTARGVARDLEVPADLVERVMYVESGGDRWAVSSAGAIGLMQVLAGHFYAWEDGFDPYQNLRKAVGILRANFQQSGDWVVATRWYYGAPGDGYVRLVWEFFCD